MKFILCRPKQVAWRPNKLIRVMKLTMIMMTCIFMQVSASTKAQITLSEKAVSLENVLRKLKEQTDYYFFYNEHDLRLAKPVSLSVKNATLESVLKIAFAGQPLSYDIDEKTVVIKEKKPSLLDNIIRSLSAIDVRGRVTGTNFTPLVGATISIPGRKPVITGTDGRFQILGIEEGTQLTVSYIGYVEKVIVVKSTVLTISLQASDSKLDEVQVMAYGTTSRRLSTGNITKISGETINNTPVSNPMLALISRVPGMIVTQNSGVPGSQVKFQIRGRTQVDATFGANESPLFVIDGVPMAGGGDNINMLQSAISNASIGGLSAFGTLSPGDIESIEILKDADATAIYGSRGASGVILITTKRGKSGAAVIDARLRSGISKAPDPHLLNTKEYLMMRREAFANDNKTMTNANAYDLLAWDTTRTQELWKELIGGTATYNEAQLGLSGGTPLSSYSLRGSYMRETNVYAKPQPNTRATVSTNLNGRLFDGKLKYNFNASYANSINKSNNSDLAGKIYLPPHIKLYNEDGSLAWNEGGVRSVDNPLASLEERYTAKSNNLNGNLSLDYALTSDLHIRTAIGYNNIFSDELRTTPKSVLNPLDAVRVNNAQFGNRDAKSFTIDPTAEYKKGIGRGMLTVMAGGTVQRDNNQGYSFGLRDYVSDELLGSMIGISTTNSLINPASRDTEYKYAGIFGRATYNYQDTYILNISGRRDGSSRFGPNYKYASFGAVGGSWIFSNLAGLKGSKILTFGKVRASYGTAGNDKIGDYQYMSLYSTAPFSPVYRDSMALSPESFFKPDLHWEMTKKFEVAADLQFLNGRIDLSLAWYNHNTNDPLVQYPLPFITGFNVVAANLNDVVVQNRGLELMLNTVNIESKNFRWSTMLNLTLPNNRLKKYPGLEKTTYARQYVVGRSLDLVYVSKFDGVDPITGLYKVQDLNGTGRYEISNIGGDLAANFDSDPEYYGGFENSMRFKGFSLSAFFSFTKGYKRNWMSSRTAPFGLPTNVPRLALNRWQYEGQLTDVQKFTTNSQVSGSLTGPGVIGSSDAGYTNALYVGFQTLNFGYQLPAEVLKMIGVKSAGLYIQAQNLANFAPFSGVDPNTLFHPGLRPLRTYVAGIQLSL